MKKILVFFLSFSVIFSCPVFSQAADRGSLSYFTKQQTYQTGQFSDVSSSAWYASSVQTAYELGLMQGTGSHQFNGNGNLTLAETIALADRLHNIYYQDGQSFEQSSPWYQVYVDYAFDTGILTSEYSDYTRAATRADFAKILATAFPETALQSINSIEDGAIPDVSISASYASAVYQLYRAGILIGSDSTGTFHPNSYIDRASVAAIVSRMADVSLRKTITLTASSSETLSAEEIYAKCASSVAYIAVYDQNGTEIQSGSGFFIDSIGTMVTNYHVLEDGYSAKITTTDDKTYTVSGVYDYDEDRDLALLKIDGSGFSYLETDTASLNAGATIYTIGSPLGLSNTISTGIISNTSRTLNGYDYIQITAPISSGSSGGALINQNGKVIGVTSGAVTSESGVSQNLNLAIPIHYIENLSKNSVVSLASIFGNPATSSGNSSTTTYSDLYANGAPTYQSITGVNCIRTYFSSTKTSLSGYYADGDVFCYPYTSTSVVAYYLTTLNHSGWELYNTKETPYSITYYLIKDSSMIAVGYQANYAQIWISAS